MKWYRSTAIGGLLLLFGVAACADLDVLNLDDADTERVLATPGDVENLIRDSYQTWWHANYGPGFQPRAFAQLGTMSFEWTSMAANFGMIQMSLLPREPLANNTADSFFDDYFTTWYRAYAAIKAANDGLNFIRNEGGQLPGGNARGEAFASFVRALGHGTIALLYDMAVIMDENTDPVEITGADMVPYQDVMTQALAYLDETIALSEGATFTIPNTWIPGVSLSSQELANLARAYRARFRATVARTPAEREAVNWAQVIADVDDAALAQDFSPVMDNVNWRHVWHVYADFGGAWNQLNNFIYGMADVGGGYQTWRATPLGQRVPFVYNTPDLRFPQGANAATQADNPGLYFRWNGEDSWTNADRGTWRWSYYYDWREKPANPAGGELHTRAGPAPEMKVTELNLLKAEGLFRTGDPAGAADLVNITRVDNGGLNATDANGTNSDCVPRLPNGDCGGLFEMIKWEKRIETAQTHMGAWFFDMRGWGDHAAGTPLHYPAPAEDLNVLELPIHTHGGNIGDFAPTGTYDIGPPGF